MNALEHKLHNRSQRKRRIRSVISGTVARPRLSVFISNQHITAQLIDDTAQVSLAAVTTVGQKVSGTMTERATWVGTEIANKASSLKIATVVFDRGGKIYHGRVAALAEAARKSGLEF